MAFGFNCKRYFIWNIYGYVRLCNGDYRSFSVVCFAMQGVIVNLPFVPNLYAGDVYFKALFLTNVPCFGDVRNYGPFWEPGAYQLYLNWAIFTSYREERDQI